MLAYALAFKPCSEVTFEIPTTSHNLPNDFS